MQVEVGCLRKRGHLVLLLQRYAFSNEPKNCEMVAIFQRRKILSGQIRECPKNRLF